MKDTNLQRRTARTTTTTADLTLHFVIPATNMAIRRMLHGLHLSLMANGLSQSDMEHAELVLAEVLNNIVEHAYSGRSDGSIALVACLTPAMLEIELVDTGNPMPDHSLPSGTLAPHGETRDLPEGGFGWHLIRALTDRLDYARENGKNRLCLHIPRSSIGCDLLT